MERIDFRPSDLQAQRPTDVKECFLILEDGFFHYKHCFYADEPKDREDELGEWNNEFNYVETYATKSQITGVEKSWSDSSKVWGVSIIVKGFGTDIKLYFKKQTEANNAFNKILEWVNYLKP